MTLVEEGHGKTELSCRHGSRWVWWFNESVEDPDYRGEWMNVVWSSQCKCGDPPLPFKTRAEMQAYLDKKAGRQKTL